MVLSVDILCNIVGILDVYKLFLEVSDEEVEYLFDINFFVIVRLICYYFRCMVEKKLGIIINMCLIVSFIVGGGGVVYISFKYVFVGFIC